MTDHTIYMGNPKLKAAGVKIQYTREEIDEFIKCSQDPIYFIENYVSVVHPKRGLVLLKLYDYQKEMITSYHTNGKTISLTGRQMGKSTIAAAFFCWYVIFNDNKSVGILANKASVSKEIMSRFQLAYENVPTFLKQGVVSFNKTFTELENGSKVYAASTSSSAIRGFSLQLLYIDEYAYVPTNIADDFFTSVYPTLAAAGDEAKLIVTSTPNGYNHYYKMWNEAIQGKNGFHPIHVTWDAHPERDEKWKKEQLDTLGEEKFNQEHLTEFLGSSNTLIPAKYIKMMSVDSAIHESEGLRIFKEPVKFNPQDPESFDHKYLIVCDPSRGTGNDNTAFIVFDITQYPIRIVATFRNPNIDPLILPTVLHRLGTTYNDAHILVEINDNGQEVANILWRDLEYENTVVFGGFSRKPQFGARTDVRKKRLGCSLFKSMIESQKLIINDLDLIQEISSFIRKRHSYEADNGHYDDMTMCCVLLAWFATTDEFANLSDTNYKKEILAQNMQHIEQDVLPFGFIDDGVEDMSQEEADFWGEGVTW